MPWRFFGTTLPLPSRRAPGRVVEDAKKRNAMAFIVTSNCQRCRFTDCVDVGPVDCFHADAEMLYIDPEECIDCGACEPECPLGAVFADDSVPEQWASYTEKNKKFFGTAAP